MMKRALKSVTPSEMPQAKALASILSASEYQLFQAIDRLVDAANAGDFAVSQTAEERRDELLSMADAFADDEFDTWWWETVAPDFLDNPKKARQSAGLSKDQWQERMSTWAETYRERAGPEHAVQSMTDAQVAAFHVEDTFGVDLDTFSDEVVEWDRVEHAEGLARKNLQAAVGTIHQVAAHLEHEDADSADT